MEEGQDLSDCSVSWDRPIRDKNASPDATVSHDLIHPHCSRGESIAMKSHEDVSRVLKGVKEEDGRAVVGSHADVS